ncbi:MAG: response regulator transcription factor [Leptospiraceae bacterium]|nr:response regulator transcription factor [Leptospiraceae bacterium]MCP5499948.1 response regulator transcription factor [Leptospiraceae bacterium]
MNKKNQKFYKIIIIEDQSITRLGLINLLKNTMFPIDKISEIDNGNLLIPMLEKEIYDLLILDLDIPGKNGMILLKQVKSKFPNIKIIIFTMFDAEGFFKEAISLGADAYVLKTDEISIFPEVMRRVLLEDEFYCSLSLIKYMRKNTIEFTDKEYEIMQCLKLDFSVPEIATKMQLSKRTIEYYINKLKNKLNCESLSNLKKEIKTKYYKEVNIMSREDSLD